MQTHDLVNHLGAWSAGKGPLQRKLAHALMQAIRHGALNPGIRLPSERDLADALTISRTTVVAAYDALREGGWVESRTGSGTFVGRSGVVAGARGAAQARALAASPLLGLLSAHDAQDLVDLVLGAPLPLSGLPLSLFTLPPEEYGALVNDRRYYALGLPTLRQAIASYYGKAGLATRPSRFSSQPERSRAFHFVPGCTCSAATPLWSRIRPTSACSTRSARLAPASRQWPSNPKAFRLPRSASESSPPHLVSSI
jgi:DNA-binding transcriptional regulator YhcF (GntR family)